MSARSLAKQHLLSYYTSLSIIYLSFCLVLLKLHENAPAKENRISKDVSCEKLSESEECL